MHTYNNKNVVRNRKIFDEDYEYSLLFKDGLDPVTKRDVIPWTDAQRENAVIFKFPVRIDSLYNFVHVKAFFTENRYRLDPENDSIGFVEGLHSYIKGLAGTRQRLAEIKEKMQKRREERESVSENRDNSSDEVSPPLVDLHQLRVDLGSVSVGSYEADHYVDDDDLSVVTYVDHAAKIQVKESVYLCGELNNHEQYSEDVDRDIGSDDFYDKQYSEEGIFVSYENCDDDSNRITQKELLDIECNLEETIRSLEDKLRQKGHSIELERQLFTNRYLDVREVNLEWKEFEDESLLFVDDSLVEHMDDILAESDMYEEAECNFPDKEESLWDLIDKNIFVATEDQAHQYYNLHRNELREYDVPIIIKESATGTQSDWITSFPYNYLYDNGSGMTSLDFRVLAQVSLYSSLYRNDDDIRDKIDVNDVRYMKNRQYFDFYFSSKKKKKQVMSELNYSDEQWSKLHFMLGEASACFEKDRDAVYLLNKYELCRTMIALQKVGVYLDYNDQAFIDEWLIWILTRSHIIRRKIYRDLMIQGSREKDWFNVVKKMSLSQLYSLYDYYGDVDFMRDVFDKVVICRYLDYIIRSLIVFIRDRDKGCSLCCF